MHFHRGIKGLKAQPSAGGGEAGVKTAEVLGLAPLPALVISKQVEQVRPGNRGSVTLPGVGRQLPPGLRLIA